MMDSKYFFSISRNGRERVAERCKTCRSSLGQEPISVLAERHESPGSGQSTLKYTMKVELRAGLFLLKGPGGDETARGRGERSQPAKNKELWAPSFS
jgi:hypothetical protein